MGRSKNSDGIGDEFTASKKHGKKKIVSKDKNIINKMSMPKKMQIKNITLHRKKGITHVGLNLHKNPIRMVTIDRKNALLCNYKFRQT